MRTLRCITFCLVAAIFCSQAIALDWDEAEETVEIGIAEFLIPDDLKSSEDALILIRSTTPPGGCRKWAGYSVTHMSDFVHSMKAFSTFKNQCFSQMAFFVKEVDMGQLKPGTHTIKYLNSHGDPSEVIFYVDPSQ
tara:strand:- start:350 stop:757 length:408 start_codon:yes stop_codon:yes gene_type:complete